MAQEYLTIEVGIYGPRGLREHRPGSKVTGREALARALMCRQALIFRGGPGKDQSVPSAWRGQAVFWEGELRRCGRGSSDLAKCQPVLPELGVEVLAWERDAQLPSAGQKLAANADQEGSGRFGAPSA